MARGRKRRLSSLADTPTTAPAATGSPVLASSPAAVSAAPDAEPFRIGLPDDLPPDREQAVRELLVAHPGPQTAEVRIGGRLAAQVSIAPSAALKAGMEAIIGRSAKRDVHDGALSLAEAAKLLAAENPYPAELPLFGWLLGRNTRLESLELVVASELECRYPEEATCGELWRAIYPHYRDTQTGEVYVRDESTDPDKTTWLRLEGRDDLRTTQLERERTLKFDRVEPLNPYADRVRPPIGTPPPAPIHLRKVVLVRLASLGLPIASSGSATDAGYRLVVDEQEMRKSQAGRRKALETELRRLDHQLEVVHRLDHLLATGSLVSAVTPDAADVTPRDSEHYRTARLEELAGRRRDAAERKQTRRGRPGRRAPQRRAGQTTTKQDYPTWEEAIGR